jgi:hypothetical protein
VASGREFFMSASQSLSFSEGSPSESEPRIEQLTSNGSDVLGVIKDLRSEISERDPEVLGRYPVEQYCKSLGRLPAHRGYTHIASEAVRTSERIAQRGGVAMVGRYHKLVLATLVSEFEDRLPSQRIPASIESLMRLEIARIVEQLGVQDEAFYDFSNDLFLKDLGLATFRLLPCGSELLLVHAAIPRSLLFRGGITQFLRGVYFFLGKTRGFRPFYSLHMDPRRLEEFNPDGWDRSYLRVADLLALHPEVKGLFGTAWFYDPHLEEISPRLAYIRKRREEGGAWNFRYGTRADVVSGALSKSATRRRLYQDGRYIPTSHYLVWPRDNLLGWAAGHRGYVPAKDGY